MKTKLSNDMNVILGALVRRIKQRAYLDSDEEIARWIEEYCEQSNSHKHSVVRGGVIEAQSVQLTENDLKWVNSCVTQITPTEPLPAEGVAQNGRGGKVVKFEDPIRKKILKQIIDTTKSF